MFVIEIATQKAARAGSAGKMSDHPFGRPARGGGSIDECLSSFE